MAKKKTSEDVASSAAGTRPLTRLGSPGVQQPAAEERFADELAFLRAVDTAPRPPGWLLSPERVVDFICGTRGEAIRAPASADLPADAPKSMQIEAKFVGARRWSSAAW